MKTESLLGSLPDSPLDPFLVTGRDGNDVYDTLDLVRGLGETRRNHYLYDGRRVLELQVPLIRHEIPLPQK